MAFLDNSGDIILDAVLTDTGRYRLAKGDGSFKIVKFALSDDEINYRLYDKNNPSGSAYYDLEILQTPILEAFTNNTSTMNYKLLSIPRTNLLYLPSMRLNFRREQTATSNQNGGYIVSTTAATYDLMTLGTGGSAPNNAILRGDAPNGPGQHIRIDQGLDTLAISYQNLIDTDLLETQYIIEIDSRLGSICRNNANNTNAAVSFVDDDSIASYYISDQTGPNPFVERIRENSTPGWPTADNGNGAAGNGLVIAGPQGTTLQFGIKSTLEIITSDYLFDVLGNTILGADALAWGFADSHDYKFIDTVIKVTGATTGYKLNVAVRFFKVIT